VITFFAVSVSFRSISPDGSRRKTIGGSISKFPKWLPS